MSAGDKLSARGEAECPFLPRRGVCPSRTAQHHCGSLALSSIGRWWHGCCSRWVRAGVQSCVAKWKFSGRQAPASRAMLTFKVLSLTPRAASFLMPLQTQGQTQRTVS